MCSDGVKRHTGINSMEIDNTFIVVIIVTVQFPSLLQIGIAADRGRKKQDKTKPNLSLCF